VAITQACLSIMVGIVAFFFSIFSISDLYAYNEKVYSSVCSRNELDSIIEKLDKCSNLENADDRFPCYRSNLDSYLKCFVAIEEHHIINDTSIQASVSVPLFFYFTSANVFLTDGQNSFPGMPRQLSNNYEESWRAFVSWYNDLGDKSKEDMVSLYYSIVDNTRRIFEIIKSEKQPESTPPDTRNEVADASLLEHIQQIRAAFRDDNHLQAHSLACDMISASHHLAFASLAIQGEYLYWVSQALIYNLDRIGLNDASSRDELIRAYRSLENFEDWYIACNDAERAYLGMLFTNRYRELKKRRKLLERYSKVLPEGWPEVIPSFPKGWRDENIINK
jgi:hypothetical protein